MFYIFVGLALALVFWLIYGAKYEKQTTHVGTGEIKFVAAGESCVKVIANLKDTGYHYDQESGEIVPGNKQPFDFFGYGVYWVSLLYPLKQIWVYHFVWDKLIPKAGGVYGIERRAEYVNSLFFLYPYPVVADGVELKGNLKVKIVTNVTFRIVKPILPVFVFKGNWLAPVNSIIIGAIADFAKGMTFDEFRALNKEGSEGGDKSIFSSELLRVNDTVDNKPGIADTYGVCIERIDFVSMELEAESEEVQAAVTKRAVAAANADAAEEEARGIRTIGDAHAAALNARLEAASKHNGGMAVLQQEVLAEGLKGFTGGALSIGAGNMPFVVTTPGAKQTDQRGEKDVPEKS